MNLTPTVHASAHFRERMLERYNYFPSEDVINHLCEMIDNVHEDCTFIEDYEFPKCRFRVKYCYTEYLIVYNVISKILITVMPLKSTIKPEPATIEKVFKTDNVGQMKKTRQKHEEYRKTTKHKTKLYELVVDEEDEDEDE